MSKYSDHNVDFPEFVDLNDPLPNLVKNNQIVNKYPNLESKMIADLNLYMGLNISYSKRNRHLIDRIINMDQVGSYSAAFWLIAGYLAFDPKIADIAGENGIYMVAERLEPLFGIARFTESLKNMTRVQIKA